MNWHTRVRNALPVITGDRHRDRDIHDELAQHLADRERDLQASGLAAPEIVERLENELQAAVRRRRKLGRTRIHLWSELVQDLRYAWRQFSRSPGFAVVAVTTLALAIGATTALFSVVRGVLLRPLPYPEPQQLVRIWEVSPQGNSRNVVSPANYLDWRQRAGSFQAIGATTAVSDRALTGAGSPVKVQTIAVTPSVLDVLRGEPAFGRRFRDEEGAPNAPAVALLSQGFWRRHFGGDPSVVGRILTLDDRPTAVVGIMPPGFEFPSPDVDLLTNLTFSQGQQSERTSHNFLVIGRLREGVSVAAADDEMDAVARQLAAEHPQAMIGWSANVVSIHADDVRDVRPLLTVMMSVVVAVLLIACANLANLQLARAARRVREMAVRAALGAGRARMVRQLLTETMLLAAVGGALGVAVAAAAVPAIVAAAPADIPFIERVAIDWVVLAAAAAATVLSAAIVGIAPAVRVARADLRPVLQSVRIRGDRSQLRLRQALVVAQVGLALVLLVAAGLLVRSFWHLNRVPHGYDPAGVLAVSVELPRARYTDLSSQQRFYEQLFERLNANPAVAAAAGTTATPGQGASMTFSFAIEGRPSSNPSGREHPVPLQGITPGYFSAMRIPIVRGRSISATDRAGAPGVVMINEALARRHWPNGDAVGTRINFRPGLLPWLEIVGIAGDTRDEGLAQEPPPTIYVPFAQRAPTWAWMTWQTLLVRARNGDPLALVPEVRSTIWTLDPNLALFRVATVHELLAEQEARRRLATTLLTGFAALAVLLGTIGIYGLMSYTVSEQRHEIGIRVALGATPAVVASGVIRRGMVLALTGTAIGLGVAVMVTGALETLLYEVTPADPATFAATAGLLLAIAALATWIPARRAMRVDPVTAMRD